MSETDSEIEFETLKNHTDYEIAINNDSYIIRKKSNQRILKETTDNSNGYKVVTLNKKKCYVHRIVAEQWIKNDDPENKTVVDHINHIRTDNRISNLRWCSVSENNKNRSKHNNVVYEYLDELSDEAFFIDDYNEHYFDDLCFDPSTNCFYLYNGISYRELQYYKRKNNSLYIMVQDINHVTASITLSKFKQLYDLV